LLPFVLPRLQVLDEPEHVHTQQYNETVVVVQWWCRRCFALGERYEFACRTVDSAQTTLDKLADQVSRHTPLSLQLLLPPRPSAV
jgi:hypothetical protein